MEDCCRRWHYQIYCILHASLVCKNFWNPPRKRDSTTHFVTEGQILRFCFTMATLCTMDLPSNARQNAFTVKGASHNYAITLQSKYLMYKPFIPIKEKRGLIIKAHYLLLCFLCCNVCFIYYQPGEHSEVIATRIP